MNIYTQILPTYLYIKKHSVTGLKYFGKTIQDPYKYLGSGTRWCDHINKHGKEFIETIWVSEPYTDTLISEVALLISEHWDIVSSKEWANLKPENGVDGGDTISMKSDLEKKIIYDKQSIRMQGGNNPMYNKPCTYKMTEEQKIQWRNNISISGKGKKDSEETRKLKSKNNCRYWSGKETWNKGKKGVQLKSLETKMKVSIPITFRGIEYYSLAETVRQTGLSAFKIKKELFGDGMTPLSTFVATSK